LHRPEPVSSTTPEEAVAIKGYTVGKDGDAISLRHDFSNGEPPPTLLAGDAHWDNPDSDRNLLAAHMSQAMEQGSPIFVGGDFFCAMQGKYDKRSDKAKIRDEHASGNYLDLLVSTAAEWLKPYAENIVLVHRGNHETAIQKAHETDLTDRLCSELRRIGSPVLAGGYTGFVRFFLSEYGGQRSSLILYYRHGHGGGGPVTKGTIDFNRYGTQAEYDAIWSQHVHYATYGETAKVFLNHQSTIEHKTILEIRTPSYKDEYNKGEGGFQTERGQGPRPRGGYWLSVYKRRGTRCRYQFHVERTKQ
jgi:hypothetical protein